MKTDIYFYSFYSKGNTISLLPSGDGKYKLLINKENLGEYSNIEEAFTAAVTDTTKVSWSMGTLTDLNIPGDIEGWEKKLFASFQRLRPA
ncbi:hypothetical protein [Pseudochrobactrum saccharolyticum]|uniref:hypothetical protein n=1 Tax=Pseudochrobactrum saccharolyticum TaxID=354352 RepID=UPI00276B029D|nr:hypothetical protein [Pseudochrobactrum saccharolyticum]MDP8251490.1 hypothetical protein [Pseudochrobactrum saccharolyticum]